MFIPAVDGSHGRSLEVECARANWQHIILRRLPAMDDLFISIHHFCDPEVFESSLSRNERDARVLLVHSLDYSSFLSSFL